MADRKPYKHAISLTSQAPFCSVPLRLDAFDRCQFACAYCFAKARGGSRGVGPTANASSSAVRKRLERASANNLASALDEMLAKRVPIQFGGMTDPFSPMENSAGTSLSLLKVLTDFQYPTLISTKSILLASPPYLELLKRGNFYVRVSFTGATTALARKLEANVPSKDDRLALIEKLSNAGIATSARIQPLILGYEAEAGELISQLGIRGAKHVSVEYLKWPVETAQHQSILLARMLPRMRQQYLALGAKRVGREYVLPADAKLPALVQLQKAALNAGVLFGFADTDLLHLNTFKACCNGSDLFLKGAHFFDANVLGAIKRGMGNESIIFSDTGGSWFPERSINNYLNSHSRPKLVRDLSLSEWHNYLREKWNGSSMRGGPSSFWGIVPEEHRDRDGNVVYRASGELKAMLPITTRRLLGTE